jgi:hypothetical protein
MQTERFDILPALKEGDSLNRRSMSRTEEDILSRVDITIMRDSTAPIRSTRSGYRMLRGNINKFRVMKRQFLPGLNAGVPVPEIQ